MLRPLIVGLLLGCVCGCGYGKVACQVVDAAQAGCVVVKYLGPDGKIVEEPVDAADLRAAAQASRARRGVQ